MESVEGRDRRDREGGMKVGGGEVRRGITWGPCEHERLRIERFCVG